MKILLFLLAENCKFFIVFKTAWDEIVMELQLIRKRLKANICTFCTNVSKS